MKRLRAALLFILAATCPAHAASVTDPGSAITFTEPEGYINAAGGDCRDFFDAIRERLEDRDIARSFPLKYVFLSREDERAYDTGKSGPGKIIAVAVSEGSMSRLEFFVYKDAMKRVFDPARERASGPREKSLGIPREASAEISVLALWEHDIPEGLKSVYLSTHMLRNGRLLQVHQYENLTDMARVEAFKEEALNRLESMNFPLPDKEPAAARVFPAVGAVLLLAGISAFAYAFFRLRPGKS